MEEIKTILLILAVVLMRLSIREAISIIKSFID